MDSNSYDTLQTMESSHTYPNDIHTYEMAPQPPQQHIPAPRPTPVPHLLASRVRYAKAQDLDNTVPHGQGAHHMSNEFVFDFETEDTGPVFQLVRDLPTNFALTFRSVL